MLANFGSAANFAQPFGVAVDSHNLVYVTDYGRNTVQIFDANGVWQSQWTATATQLANPEGLAIDASGNVYIADTSNNRLQVFTTSGVHETTVGGTIGGSGNYQFQQPSGVTVGSSNQIYVVDQWNHRIQVFTATIPTPRVYLPVIYNSAP
jgi:DNA-binding beta-propeller fold protein YncE